MKTSFVTNLAVCSQFVYSLSHVLKENLRIGNNIILKLSVEAISNLQVGGST